VVAAAGRRDVDVRDHVMCRLWLRSITLRRRGADEMLVPSV
jgi:hypothetical protein